MERLVVTRGPFVEMGPFVTCTVISVPGAKRLWISSLESLAGLLRLRPLPLPFLFFSSSSSVSSRNCSKSGVMSQ